MMSNVPEEAYRFLGCVTCNWKGDTRCPRFTLEKQILYPKEQICGKRKEWIETLSVNYDKTPTFDQWRRDFLLAQQLPKIQSYIDAEERIMSRYNELDPEDYSNQEDMDKLAKQMQTFRSAYIELSKFGAELGDKQVGRDQPRKAELTIKKQPTPEQFEAWLNSDSIDITEEVKVVKQIDKKKR